ncbi:13513_t:CDS:2, partial [Gigaspora rosea]
GSISYFEDKKYQSSRIKSPDPSSLSTPSSPTESPHSSRASNLTTITTPTSVVTDHSGQSSPHSSADSIPQKYQRFLLKRMRNAALGLRCLYTAYKLNDLKSNFPDNDYSDENHNEMSKDGIYAYIRRRSQSHKRTLIVHSYQLIRFNKRTLIKQQG